MKTISPADASLSEMLLAWGANLISRTTRQIRPDLRADEVAALAAAGGNPPGT